jgi:MFS family permease
MNLSTIHKFFESKEMNLIYVSVFVMTLAESMISIFIPIYLYQLGFQIGYIILYYLLISLCFVIVALPVAKIVTRIGVKHSILLSTFFLICYYSLLNYAQIKIWVFILLPILMALNMGFYNIGYHLNFLAHSEKKRRGRQLSVMHIFLVFATALSPLIAGYIIGQFSFNVLFAVGVSFIVAGALILFMAKEEYARVKIDFKKMLSYLMNRKNHPNFLSFLGYAIESIIDRVVWPIYLILILVSYEKFGAIVTTSMIASIVVYYLIGKYSDRVDKKKIIYFATGLYFIAWIGRIFVNSAGRVLAVDTYKHLTGKILHLPWEVHSYNLAERDKYFMFIVSREIVFNLSRVLVMPLLFFVFYINYHPFIFSFILAAIFTLLYPCIRKNA